MILRRCRNAVVLTVVAAAVLLSSVPAFAHVTVQPTTAVAGTETTFTFRVPTESATASTTRIVIVLPTSNPIPAVLLEPVPGWRSSVEHRALASPVRTDDGPLTSTVSRITWTAIGRGNAIAPGQFREFTIDAGPIPAEHRLVFKALQYYSDGAVVRWIDPPVGGAEAAHPAPAVTIGSEGDAARVVPVGTGGDDNGWVTVVGLVAGLFGLACGTVALVTVRRRRAPE
jgi:periplasmic copper chaperone A